ncbi:PepSY-associated TM helix domain-containing protein [Janthinobacterium fluminis]|uniref:PepSY-associated TM helix domain-containing protein n=1 Tax=Janthinobacterium fluminis TaxID=2987524 RepID=A0ABT5K153_9BURK|nr:PepSY-associated TM helix domain-containing protein [Janthinobacterium fluminis]MDC8758709.1 PepSY-associated TM helix domain-containing protein [Janthinobacterium fluminis]
MSGAAAKQAKPPGGLRQSMAWLHTWSGLWLSWLLFAIFLTGTLAVFDDPIGHWMTPEHAIAESAHQAAPAKVSDRGRRIELGLAYMARHHGDAGMWELWPVQRPGNGLSAYWFQPNGQYGSADLDPATGAELRHDAAATVRATEGGHHFVDFHYELHAGKIGLWVVAITTMVMLVALVSGVITHKRIFKDFFTFRPAKGQRSWLDAHNAVAVLTLPFQFMIAYTGIAFYSTQYVPAPVLAQYGAGPAAVKRYNAQLMEPGKPARSGTALAVPDLEPYARRAEQSIGQEIRAIVLDNPGDASMRVCMYGWNEEAELRTRLSASSGMACYAVASGAELAVRQPGAVDGGAAVLTQHVMGGLHMAGFGGVGVRWLYFFCGLAGAAMMGTGAVLFMVKRRQRHGGEFGAATERVYRLIEGMNVAAIAGLGVACIAFLWANRLIPLGVEQRAGWEVRAFFAVWVLMLMHALVRPAARAWVEQLGLLAALCLLLPLLNIVSTGDSMAAQIARGDWESAGVELCSLAFAALAGWGAFKLHTRKHQAAAAKPAPRQPAAQAAHTEGYRG